MSKVAISGNASGTGTFTIAAPNSNTDRTLTLPDEAGTVLTDRVVAVNASAPDNSLVVDASGNAGVGVTPSAWVSGDTIVQIKAGTSSGQLWGRNGTLRIGANFYFDGTNYKYANSSYAPMNYEINSGSFTWNYAPVGTAGNNVTFSEAMRIDSSGNFLFNKTGTDVVNAGIILQKDTYGRINFVKSTASGTGGTTTCGFYYNGTSVGSIVNTSTATAYNTASDYRLKEDWIAVADASTRVKALKPVNFAWKADGKRVDGFLAHELAEVVPEAVTGEKDAVELVDITDEQGNVTGQEERPVYQGIDQSKLVPLLTAALQEALAEIETLKADVAALKGTA